MTNLAIARAHIGTIPSSWEGRIDGRAMEWDLIRGMTSESARVENAVRGWEPGVGSVVFFQNSCGCAPGSPSHTFATLNSIG
jgi:hypothetical protein